jgi:hypothetical protein
MTTREWTFRHVSPAEAGDFIQITFSDDPDSTDKYVLLSTQFEFPQDHDIQVEVDGGEWYAQIKVKNATVSQTTLTIDGVAYADPVRLVINYVADEDDFRELVRVVKIMLPSVVVLR